jgi:anti-sigma regulatory factor (Ser/Thr protein kinase)
VGDPPDLLEGTEPLEPDDTLILYTDGLVERRGESLDEGLARLAQAASSLAEEDPGPLCSHLIDLLVGDVDLADDIALLVARTWPELRRQARARPEVLSELRGAIRGWLGRQVPLGDLDDLVLACSEAAANVVEHAYVDMSTGVEPRIDMRARLGGDRIVTMIVRDQGRWREDAIGPHRGNGLGIVRALMDDVAIERTDDGTTVRMVKQVGSRSSEPS